MQQHVDKQVAEWRRDGVVIKAPVGCKWNSPLLCVRQLDHTGTNVKFRVCIDPRRVNSRSEDDKFPIPLMSDILEAMTGCEEISELDLEKPYNQLPVAPES